MRVDVVLDPDTPPAEITELGLLAERQGIGAVWTSNYPSSRDPFITLCPLALASRTIRLGPLVITPYELHPLKTSKALSSLNELCKGRANILVGGPTGVMATMGINPTRMVGMVRECAEILKAVSPAGTLNYDGKYFQVWGYRPTWATETPPVVYVGANREQMLGMAARVGDGIMLGDMTAPRLATALETIDKGLAAAKRRRADVRIGGLVAWHVKEDRQQAIAEARQQLALRGMLDSWYLQPFLSDEECRFVAAHQGAFFHAYKNRTPVIEGVPDSLVNKIIDNLTCTGDLSDVGAHVERLKKLGAMGLTEVALKLHRDQAAAIRIIGEHVVPALR
jgi:alkanesulfonate monooxygenase SsuD/methylene tetrahydromethanopterin reductase-like flavin-dependent oxidoreductase (luciferase family)